MERVAGDGVVVAGFQMLALAADGEMHLALQQQAELLVRMLVLGDQRVRRQLDAGEHELLAGDEAGADTGKELLGGDGGPVDEVGLTHCWGALLDNPGGSCWSRRVGRRTPMESRALVSTTSVKAARSEEHTSELQS